MQLRNVLIAVAVALALGVGVGAGVYAVTANKDDITANKDDINTLERVVRLVNREGRDRRDQSCRGLELGHKQEIADLRRIYRDLKRTQRFFANPPPQFEGLLDNPLVLEGLRDDKQDARRATRAAKNDQDRYGVFVPAYCDDPGFGLPEPDPKVPKRPSSLGGTP